MVAHGAVLGLAVLAFAAWAVSLGGLASLQDDCQPGWSDGLSSIRGVSAGLPCYRVFRYYWFIISAEFVAVVGLIIAVVGGHYPKTRQSFLGLFAIVSLLYIQTADTFYTITNTELTGQLKHRANTMAAGSIMVAALNCLLVLALGLAPSEAAEANEHKSVEAKHATAV